MEEQTASGGVPRHISLVQKLAEVMAAVHRIPKRGRNEHFKYDYAMEADITDAVRGLLAERHVILIPSIESVSRDGKLTTIMMRFTFYDGDSDETIELGWAGCGEDSADKGLYKALTGAIKYVLTKSFLIPTGDDPEQDIKPKRQATRPEPSRVPDLVDANDTRPISPPQAARLKALLRTHNTNVDEFKAWVDKRFKYTKAEDIQRKDYDAITRYIVEGIDATEMVGA